MKRRGSLVCVLMISAVLPAVARAEHTRYWRETDSSDFEKGTAKGVAIRSDGKLTPAPKFESFADPNLAYLWALRLDSRGRLYAAGGSDARVLRFDDSGKATTVFESSELVAQTIAFDSKDNLYVATSPDGKVYRVTSDGTKSVFFEPKTKYIWSLAFDSQGDLFVATGDAGQVFVVTPDGKGQLFYQSKERHARSLTFDSNGNLLVGTEPDGLVLRLKVVRKGATAVPEAAEPFVVYETSKTEVTSLITDAGGNLYAASIGEKAPAPVAPRFLPGATPQPPITVTVPAGGATPQVPAQVPQAPAPMSFPSVSIAGGAEVVKIAPDGSPETLWTSHDDLIFALGFSATGRLLLGTGNSGSLIEVQSDGVFATVAKMASAQVMGFAPKPDGSVFVATANPGKVFTLGPGYETSGSFESDPFDAKIFSRWGRLTWWGENGATDGKVAFYVRSGNTSNPEENWSAWAGPYKNPAGETAECPPARFAQWKAVFLGGGQAKPPSVSWVSLAYLPKNVPPVIDDIAIQDPGIRVVGYPSAAAGQGLSAPVPLRNPRSPGSNPSFGAARTESPAKTPPMEAPMQGIEQKGYQSILWSAHDDNDDDLIFTIFFRGENEQNWRLLKDNVTQTYYTWDSTSMPDGAYYVKIVASDSPSNPAKEALSSERTSGRFEIVNTPPRIENLKAGSGVLNTKASFDAISSSSVIAHAQYSIDSGDWQTIFPTGLLSDSPKESYFMELPGLPLGEHTLAVQVTDRFDNTAAAKITFIVSQRASE